MTHNGAQVNELGKYLQGESQDTGDEGRLKK